MDGQVIKLKWLKYGLFSLNILCFWIFYTVRTYSIDEGSHSLLMTILINLIFVFLTFSISPAFTWLIQRKYPGTELVIKRFGLVIILALPLTTLVMLAHMSLMDHYDFSYFNNPVKFLAEFMSAVSVCTALFVYMETFYFVSEFDKTEKLNRKLEVANYEGQLRNLKTKVNPHFLFNSLNNLSSLISVNPVLAEKFVINLSQVYRVFLQQNKTGISTVKDELAFMKLYFEILKERHGSGIALDVRIEEKTESYRLPSLILQESLDYLIQAYVTAPECPLTVSLDVDSAKLVMKGVGEIKKHGNQPDQHALDDICTRLHHHGYTYSLQTENNFELQINWVK